MQDEVELKLALTPEDLKRLRRHPLVRSLARGRARTRKLVSVYYDTPERSLQRQGMALRVRHIGQRRVQTLKAVAEGGLRSLKHYREYEAELEGEQPDLGLIDDEGLQAQLLADGVADKLAPVFTTTFQRASIPLRFADSDLELALDQGEITAGDSQLPICEAELELVSGRSTRIYELALALGERVTFNLERRTKASRGYSLGEKVALKSVKANEASLKPDMTARSAFELAARSCLTQICANEPVVLAAGDIEGVHQLRVGVRRLRAVLAAFAPIIRPDALDYLRSELRWLQQCLGAAREWDVFIDETLEPLKRRWTEATGMAELTLAAQSMRDEAYRQAAASLRSQRYTELLLRTDLWLEDGGWAAETLPGDEPLGEMPVSKFARQTLDKRDRRLRKLSKKHASLTETEMHGVRLLAKKKRYCLEFFGSLYRRKLVRETLESLKAIQNKLGTYNDAVVGARLLDEIAEAMGDEASQDLLTASAAVRGWQSATMDRDINDFRAAWAEYETGPRFWRG